MIKHPFDFASHYQKQTSYTTAIEYSNKGLQRIKNQADAKRWFTELLTIKEECYVALGNYKKAYEIKNEIVAYRDSLNEQVSDEKIKELQTKFEVNQKELENNLLKAETATNQKTIQSRTITAIALFLVLLLLGSWAIVVNRINQQKQRYNQELEATVAARTLALQTANKNLEQANYELKTFNYIASHDIKEPIRNIGSYAGLIFRKLPPEYQMNLKHYFDTIKKSSQQLYTLIEDFAKYSQMSKDEQIEMKPLDLNTMVESLEMSIHPNLQEKNARIINEGLPVIHSSPSFLYTILKNLIENGLKFNNSAVPTVTISYSEQKLFHEIHVTDNGIGIEPAYQNKIFEMFKRLHNRDEYQGSGIGLAIVKLLIEKINGQIQLKSKVNKGSTFIIQLPKQSRQTI